MTNDDAGRTFSFDSENHLTSGTKAGAETTYFYYGYDPFGRRVRKTVEIGCGVSKERYVYDGPQCIAECDDAGVVLRKFIYGSGIDEPLMLIPSDLLIL